MNDTPYVQKPGQPDNSTKVESTGNRYYRSAEMKEKIEKDSQKGIKNFDTFGLPTVLFAIFATFCLFKNARGITFPFYTAGTIFYFVYCIKKLGSEIKKSNLFYLISLMLLGISMFLTEDHQMTGLAKWTMFILVIIFCLHNSYDDSEWELISYLYAVCLYIGKIFENLASPFADMNSYIKDVKKKNASLNEEEKVKKSTITYILLGIIVSIPLLIVVLNLLCEADAVFKEACEGFIELIKIENIIQVIIMLAIVYVVFYAMVKFLADRTLNIEGKDRRVHEPVFAITVSVILTIVYLLFCGIQIMYLFTKTMELPDGYTYAEYAHEGFYQLLAVCVLNLIIVLIGTHFFRKHTVLNIILTIISICTYIMMASSAYRMYMYVSSYDLSRLRLYVIIGLAVVAILMIGVMLSI